jgi:predicted transposase YdaD
MLLAGEWNWEDALAVRFQEGRQEGHQEERQGIARNAQNALAEGIPPEVVSKIVGMDIEAIKRIAGQ